MRPSVDVRRLHPHCFLHCVHRDRALWLLPERALVDASGIRAAAEFAPAERWVEATRRRPSTSHRDVRGRERDRPASAATCLCCGDASAQPIDSMRSWPCGTATRPRSGILCVSPLGGVVRIADGVTERSGAPPPPQPSPPCRPRRCLRARLPRPRRRLRARVPRRRRRRHRPRSRHTRRRRPHRCPRDHLRARRRRSR
jgi:hypothetical protein